MKKLILFLGLIASLNANIDIKSIDIYNNKTFVNQNVDISKKSISLIGEVKLEDIRFISSNSCEIKNSAVSYEEFDLKDLSKELASINNEIKLKENRIFAIKTKNTLIQNNSLKIDNIDNLKNISNFVENEIFKNLNEINKIELELKDLNERLKRLNENKKARFTKLTFDSNCKDDSLIVSYPFDNLEKKGFQEISYNSSKNLIEIKKLYYFKQNSGFDLKNFDINLYNYGFIQQINPNRFYPRYLDIIEPIVLQERVQKSAKVTLSMNAMAPVSDQQNFYIEDSTKSYFKTTNVTLMNNIKSEVLFFNDKYKAKNSLEIDGYSQSQPFFKVDFKSDKEYGVVNSKLYLDGNFIGENRFIEIKKDKESSIYFATNSFIDIKKELIKDIKEEPLFSINKIKSQTIWNYTIKNNSSKVEDIVLIDRVPVSKHEDIKVKIIGTTNYTQLDKNGKIHFNFKLKPNETKTINFGYEIEKPNKN